MQKQQYGVLRIKSLRVLGTNVIKRGTTMLSTNRSPLLFTLSLICSGILSAWYVSTIGSQYLLPSCRACLRNSYSWTKAQSLLSNQAVRITPTQSHLPLELRTMSFEETLTDNLTRNWGCRTSRWLEIILKTVDRWAMFFSNRLFNVAHKKQLHCVEFVQELVKHFRVSVSPVAMSKLLWA